jgi:hypothetical protein
MGRERQWGSQWTAWVELIAFRREAVLLDRLADLNLV